MAELRVTDTNSANDNRGSGFGLEGNDFIYVLVAFVAALAVYAVCTTVLRIPALGAVVLALPIFAAPTAWVLLLRHNKPAGYAEDWFEHLVNREGWSYAPRTQLPTARNMPREHSRP